MCFSVAAGVQEPRAFHNSGTHMPYADPLVNEVSKLVFTPQLQQLMKSGARDNSHLALLVSGDLLTKQDISVVLQELEGKVGAG